MEEKVEALERMYKGPERNIVLYSVTLVASLNSLIRL